MTGYFSKILLFSCCLLCLPVEAAVKQSIPTDESGFTKYVAKRLRKELPGEKVRVKGPLTLLVEQTNINLDRIFSFCQREQAGCAAEIATYVKGVADIRAGRGTEATKDSIRLIVRSAAYVRQAQRVPEGETGIQSRHLAEDLFAIPVFDRPRSTRLVHLGDHARLGMTADEVYELGVANLRKILHPLPARAMRRGEIGAVTSDYFAPGRLVLHDSWRQIAEAQKGVLIVAVPSTDRVIYVSDDSDEFIAALRTIVQEMAKQSSNPLSQTLLRWRPDGWEVVR
jgi:uncharacterized protein YtpQ (UPF0354 family)